MFSTALLPSFEETETMILFKSKQSLFSGYCNLLNWVSLFSLAFSFFTAYFEFPAATLFIDPSLDAEKTFMESAEDAITDL